MVRYSELIITRSERLQKQKKTPRRCIKKFWMNSGTHCVVLIPTGLVPGAAQLHRRRLSKNRPRDVPVVRLSTIPSISPRPPAQEMKCFEKKQNRRLFANNNLFTQHLISSADDYLVFAKIWQYFTVLARWNPRAEAANYPGWQQRRVSLRISCRNGSGYSGTLTK